MLTERGSNNVFRRDAIKKTAIFLAEIVVAVKAGVLILPSVAAAQQTERPWSGRITNWWPNSQSYALAHNLHTLHESGGPLHVYDEAHRAYFNSPSNAREWEEEIAKAHLEQNPGRESWSGYCRETYMIGFMEDLPPDYINPAVTGVGSDRSTMEGLLVAKHITDHALGYTEDPDGIRRLLSLHPERRIVVDAPDGQAGRWFRAVYAVTENSFLGTNFGYPDKWMPVTSIVSAQIPYHLPYEYGQAQPTEPVNPNLFRQANPYLSHRFIDFLVYGAPLEGNRALGALVLTKRDILNRVISSLRKIA